MNTDPYWDKAWADIRPGQPVRLSHRDGQRIIAVFDMRTEDGSVVWVHLSGGAGRRLIHKEDGYSPAAMKD